LKSKARRLTGFLFVFNPQFSSNSLSQAGGLSRHACLEACLKAVQPA
jgi:hypothetical protein